MTDQPNIAAPERLKRFTLARVMGEAAKAKYPKPTALVDVAYHVDAIAQEESPDGSYPRFMGEFRAINLLTGEVYVAANAVFPSLLSAPIEAAKGDASPNITGHAVITKGPDGYSVEHVIEAARRSVLDLLEGWHVCEMAGVQPPPTSSEAPKEPKGA